MSLSDKRKGSKGNSDYWYEEKDLIKCLKELREWWCNCQAEDEPPCKYCQSYEEIFGNELMRDVIVEESEVGE